MASDHLGYTADFDELQSECQRNNLAKAMLIMQQALSINSQRGSYEQQEKLLTVSPMLYNTAINCRNRNQ